MPPVTAMVVGPDEHGVVRHAMTIAEAVDARIERRFDLSTVTAGAAGSGVCHWHFTDRLFGSSIEEAAASFVDTLAVATARHVVTLHDVPAPTGSSRSARRVDGYRQVAEAADGLVVASAHERHACGGPASPHPSSSSRCRSCRSARRPHGGGRQRRRSVAILGFVYPGKGHAEVIAAVRSLPPDVQVVALGRPSNGHEPLVECLRRTATSMDRRLLVTGYLDDATLADALHQVDVPVVAARSVSASASVATWIAAGRRPLVAAQRVHDRARCPRRRPRHVVRPGGPDHGDRACHRRPGDDASPWTDPDDAAAVHRRRGPLRAVRTHGTMTEPVEHEGRLWVPGNRWDLIVDRIGAGPRQRSAVVVTHFEQPTSLGADVRAPSLTSTRPGSSWSWPTTGRHILRHHRRVTSRCRPPSSGRRTGAVGRAPPATWRRSIDGSPEPRLPRCRHRARTRDGRSPRRLARRRARRTRRRPGGHVDLTGWTPPAPSPGSRDSGPHRRGGPTQPGWPTATARTHDLLEVDHRSYRFVISAVMACARSLWDDIGGFDATRDEYGGEDWELAYRAHNNGALLVHDPDVRRLARRAGLGADAAVATTARTTRRSGSGRSSRSRRRAGMRIGAAMAGRPHRGVDRSGQYRRVHRHRGRRPPVRASLIPASTSSATSPGGPPATSATTLESPPHRRRRSNASAPATP